MIAVPYFKALRELGGARRIVEDEVTDKVGRYGSDRWRISSNDQPFGDRRTGEPSTERSKRLA